MLIGKIFCVKFLKPKTVDLEKFSLYTDCMTTTKSSDYISLTNVNPAHRVMRIAIKKSLVMTVHNALITREDGLTEHVTYVFCPPHGTWEVGEPYQAVLDQLNT